MHAERDKDSILLSMGHFESQILRQILTFIHKEYETNPANLDPDTAASWYNLAALTYMSPAEKTDWLQQMHELRGNRGPLLTKWIEALRVDPSPLPVELSLPLMEIPDFLAVINDHRLLAAARNRIGQLEMDIEDRETFQLLPPPQQSALTEIKFLGILMEYLIYLLSLQPPDEEAGDKQKTPDPKGPEV
jgi:hypothetical protein